MVVASIYIDRLLQISLGFQSSAHWLFLIVASSGALTFRGFGGIFEGHCKFFNVTSAVNIIETEANIPTKRRRQSQAPETGIKTRNKEVCKPLSS